MTDKKPHHRPTKFSQEMVEKAWAYLNDGWKELEDHTFPSVLGLAIHLNVARSTLYKWAEDDKTTFSDILSAAVELNEFFLVNMGAKGDTNATITKLILGKHGYHDKIDNYTSNELEKMPTEVLEQRLKQLEGQKDRVH